VVAVDAVDAALRRINKHVFVEGGLADALGDVVFFGERFASGFVFYKFNAEEETESSDFADVGMAGMNATIDDRDLHSPS